MATRKRLTDDQLFKLADEAHRRWGTVTVSSLQIAAGGGSSARFRRIIAEWEQQHREGSGIAGSNGTRIRKQSPQDRQAVLTSETLGASAADSREEADQAVRETRTSRPADHDSLILDAGGKAASPLLADSELGGSGAAYDRLLKEFQASRSAHAEETARLNRLIDVLLDELRARR